MQTDWDVIIIGAGAAGLFCAKQAAKRGRSTLVLERGAIAGRKIALSGGGRCNFTNLNAGPEHFICTNLHFVKAALARFTPHDFLEMIENHGIGFQEKSAGQLFCRDSAKAIVRFLLQECAASAVTIRTGCEIKEIRKEQRFLIETNSNRLTCQSLVVATGGLSYPQVGATDFGYRIAEQFGLSVIPARPALAPFLFSKEDRIRFCHLSGISLDVSVRLGKREFRDAMLFTHRGLSGPAILQISSYWSPPMVVQIDLMPGRKLEGLFIEERSSAKELKTILSRYWPERFSKFWTEHCGIFKPMRQYSDRELRKIEEQIHAWRIIPAGTEGYHIAEVTAGGVDTHELSSQTMEARRQPGLYFIGEVVDVTGQLGGFNLQWAWSSGYSAGQAV
jgi:predicted Rossmann fold flavoprotein